MTRTLGAAAAAALALAAVALAAQQKDTLKLTANLKARSEVPKATGVPAGAVGLFTGTAVELENDKARVTWRLTFSKLSGRAAAAHIHTGKPGKAGGVMLALCGPCRNGQRGSSNISHAQLRKIRSGGAYVNVHTARNAAGEIRGQVKASEASSSPGPAPTPTTPEPSPYPPYP
ncbi:MAG: CHRD domain-containing protein [Gaiellaceae bacterium]